MQLGGIFSCDISMCVDSCNYVKCFCSRFKTLIQVSSSIAVMDLYLVALEEIALEGLEGKVLHVFVK